MKTINENQLPDLVASLQKSKTGYGHFKISITLPDDKEVYTVTINTKAIDAAFDDYYDEDDTAGKYYESQLEAQLALVNEILKDNKIEIN